MFCPDLADFPRNPLCGEFREDVVLTFLFMSWGKLSHLYTLFDRVVICCETRIYHSFTHLCRPTIIRINRVATYNYGPFTCPLTVLNLTAHWVSFAYSCHSMVHQQFFLCGVCGPSRNPSHCCWPCPKIPFVVNSFLWIWMVKFSMTICEKRNS